MDYCKTIEYRIIPMEACKIIRNCSGCGKKEKFLSTGNFRVNANGNQIDVWLIYQCEKCKHTYNLTIYERTRPSKIPKELYLKFLSNNTETALEYGVSKEVFGKNKAQADWDEIEYTIEPVEKSRQVSHNEADREAGIAGKRNNVQIYLWKKDGCEEKLIIHNPYGIPVRMDKILSEILQLSRTQIKKLIKEERIVPLSASGV